MLSAGHRPASADPIMAKRVLFSGSIAGNVVGYGGNTWAFLQWVLGFRRLGFEVYYVEESRGPEYLDEQFKPVPFLESANACLTEVKSKTRPFYPTRR